MLPEITSQALVYVGWVLLIYFILANVGYYLFVQTLGLVSLRNEMETDFWDPSEQLADSPFLPGIAIISPVYNEYDTILETAQSYIDTRYPDKDVILVNDGSTDGTLEKLRKEYELEPIKGEMPVDAPSEPVQGVYRSKTIDNLYVIDKENGGIGDAENPAIWFTDKPLFCIIDSDSFLEPDALQRLVRPFLERPSETVAVGGTINIANPSTATGNEISDVGTPRNPLVGLQIIEYLRAYYSLKLGLTLIRSLHNISGACGMFRTDVVREVGGYHRETKAEDMEMILRLHRYFRDRGEAYRMDHVAAPVAWTEAKQSRRSLASQRRRWYQGTIEVLVIHRGMFANPRYGMIGLFAIPGFALAEVFGRMVEGTSYLLIPLILVLGVVSVENFLIVMTILFGFATFLGWLGVLSDALTYRGYQGPKLIAVLLLYGIFEHLGFRQWRVFVGLPGVLDVLRDDISWRKMRIER